MSNIAQVIKVDSTPDGDAPLWVREAWVGCIMPCEPECGHIPAYVTGVLEKPSKGFLTAKDVLSGAAKPSRKVAGFSVDTKVALQVLAKKSPRAAKWFYDHGYPKANMAFRFKAEEVKVIEFVPDGQGGTLVRYCDMETGSMRPV